MSFNVLFVYNTTKYTPMKLNISNLIRLAFLAITLIFLLSNSGNPPNGRTGAPGETTCGGCHNNGNYQGTVSISGVPASIMPNTTYTVTLTNNVTSGSPVTGGFQIVTLDEDNNNIGDLIDISSDVRTNFGSLGREYAEQNGAKSYGGGSSVSWTFDWTSPATAPQNGDITFYYVMNMTNGAGNTSSDNSITSSTTVNLLAANNPLTVSVSKIDDVSCFGGSDGAAVANASDGSGSYSYLWSNGQTSSTVTNLSAGTNSVTVTDSDGATATGSVIILQPSILNASISSSDVSCNGEDDGIAVAIPSGGTSPYQFLWSNGVTSASNTGLIAGNYTVTITDFNSCQTVESVLVGEPSLLDGTIFTDSPISCFGESDGALSIAVSGGTPSYNFLWSNGSTSSAIAGLDAGVYTVTVTDNNNCEFIQGFNLTSPSPLALSVLTTDETAPNANDGTATATVSGGTPSYSFNWSNGGTGTSINELAPGSYSLTVTDSEGCVAEEAFVIVAVPCALAATNTSADPSCFGGNDGLIDVQVSGATGTITYVWSHDPNLNSSSATDLNSGTYFVTVTDETLCSEQLVITLGQPSLIQPSASVSDVSCNDLCDGVASVNPSGGTGDLNVLWSTGDTGLVVTDLCAGIYNVTITDSNACSSNTSVTVQNISAISSLANLTDVSCFGAEDGLVDISVSGGAGGYSFVWSTGAVTEDVNSLASGDYSVTITDANNCSIIEAYSIDSPLELTVESIVTNESANGANDGSISLLVSGGTASYSYDWSNGETTAIIESLSPGLYTATISDQNECSTVVSETILAFDCALALETASNMPSCFQGTDGSISVVVIGGTLPVSYLWSTGDTSSAINNLSAGIYSLTVTDFADCVSSVDVVLEEPSELDASGIVVNPTCAAICNGSIDLDISGGTGPYDILWSNGLNGQTITDLCEGLIAATITDEMGCVLEVSFTLEDPLALDAEVLFEELDCEGSAGTMMWVEVENDQNGYTVNWLPGDLTSDTIEIEDLDYTVIITDQLGCVAEIIVDYDYLEPLSASLELEPISSVGANDASISVSPFGGSAPYNYLWNTSAEDQVISDLAPGEYTVTITDSNECSSVVSVVVDEFECNLIVEAIITNPQCSDEETGSISLELDNYAAPIEYTWSTGSADSLITNLTVGVYTLELTDGNGCSYSGSYEIASTDISPPNLTTSGLQVVLDDSGLFDLEESLILSILDDDCSISSVEYFPSSFSCSNLGDNLIELTACDNNDNCFTGSFLLNLSDETGPVFSCPEDAIIPYCLDAYFYDIEVQDNCSDDIDVQLIEGLETGSDFPYGETTVVFTASDESGNTSECVFNIIKEDVTGIDVSFEDSSEAMSAGDTLLIIEAIAALGSNSTLIDVSFGWYSGGELISESQDGSDIDFMDYEFLELVLSYDDYCFESYYFEIDFNTAVQARFKKDVELFPNPSSAVVFIRGVDDESATFELYNVNGLRLDNVVFEQNTAGVDLDVSQLRPDLYFMKISFEDGVILKRIIVF